MHPTTIRGGGKRPIKIPCKKKVKHTWHITVTKVSLTCKPNEVKTKKNTVLLSWSAALRVPVCPARDWQQKIDCVLDVVVALVNPFSADCLMWLSRKYFTWLTMPACRDPSSCNDLPIPNNAWCSNIVKHEPCAQKIVFGGSISHGTSKDFVFWCIYLFVYTYSRFATQTTRLSYAVQPPIGTVQNPQPLKWFCKCKRSSLLPKQNLYIEMHQLVFFFAKYIWNSTRWRQSIALNTSNTCSCLTKPGLGMIGNPAEPFLTAFNRLKPFI